ncbi:SufD family Fe-S cluster assembly protein [Xanthomonas campestris pv. incanae]|nr:SufD family Fe-S cluster assembly protein [Xanthomonas campestris pv. incanae]
MAGEMPFRYACLLAAPISTLFDPQGHDADELRTAHSSTVGQLDDSELLYLRSRGLSGAAPGWAPSRHTRGGSNTWLVAVATYQVTRKRSVPLHSAKRACATDGVVIGTLCAGWPLADSSRSS